VGQRAGNRPRRGQAPGDAAKEAKYVLFLFLVEFFEMVEGGSRCVFASVWRS
jgi:hypothetical protein